jgi:anti-sigma factor RsiW
MSMSEQTSSPPKELTCEQVRELLSDYIDREISKDEKSAVEHHLSTCLKCANESHNIQGLKRVAQQWPGAQASGEFRKSVMQRMIRESQQMPAAGIRQAADAAAAQSARALAPEDDEDTKNLPPIWILAAAITLAIGVYYLILWLRGV